MKRFFIIISYSLYLFILLGVFLHTSAHPQILGKYTYKYVMLLVFLVILFPLFLLLLSFMIRTSTIRFKKRKVIVSPVKKVLIILTLIILFVLVPTETFLRYKYRDYETNSYHYTADNFDPFLQSRIAKQENLPVNSLGFRGEEISRTKPKDTYRIVILGGSTVLNREVTYEKNAARLLEKQLRQKFPQTHIEVINAGKDYYTSEHSLIQFMFKVSDLDPDLIIMWHGVNDMWASCLLEGQLTHGDYKSDYSHLYGAVSNIIFGYFQPKPVIQFKLLSFDFLIKSLQDNIYSDLISNIKERKIALAVQEYKENKNTIKVHDFPSIDAYKRNLTYLISLTKNKNIPLILGNQANLYKNNNSFSEVKAMYYRRCMKDGKDYDIESLKYGLDLFNAATKDIAAKNNIMFIDFDKQIPKNLNYFIDNVHYTEAGNELIAQTLYKYIIENNIIY